jgi:hypothetical protein
MPPTSRLVDLAAERTAPRIPFAKIHHLAPER